MGKRIPFLLGFVLLIVALWLQTTSYLPVVRLLDRLENLAYDMQIHSRLLHPVKLKDPPVVIVDVDDKSLQTEGRWPWPRAKLGELVTHLRTGGAVVTAFDMLFSESETNVVSEVKKALNARKMATPQIDLLLQKIMPDYDNDALFARSFTQGMDVLLGFSFTFQREQIGLLPRPAIVLPENSQLPGIINTNGYLASIPSLASAAKSGGFINIYPDEDGIIRRVPLVIRYKNGIYPSLALEAVRIFLLGQIKLKTAEYLDENRIEGVILGRHEIITDSRGEAIIPFAGGAGTFPTYSATNVLHDKIPAGALQGKIVFIGSSATGLGDLKATAVENIYPGVEIHATMALSILEDTYLSKPAWAIGLEVSLTAVSGLLLLFVCPFFGPRTLGLFVLVTPFVLIFLDDLLLQHTGYIISVLIPILLCMSIAIMNILYGYLFESRRREQLREMFGQYVPEKHIDEMLLAGDQVSLHGEDRIMTVLFADIRDFTTLSEGLSAEALKEMLNAFLTPMTEIIFRHNGTIDKYVGDMIMAFWGAPLNDPDHAENAIRAALEMQQGIRALHETFIKKGWPEIRMGTGLNTGLMRVGDMGSRFRRNYTVLGDAVNLASRVEGLTKFYGADIIVTESTCSNQKDFVFRKLDRVRVKGKKNSITIYEVLCKTADLTTAQSESLARYHAALEACFNQEWEKSHALFTALAAESPDCRLYELYLHRVDALAKNPPPADWDGVFVHTAK